MRIPGLGLEIRRAPKMRQKQLPQLHAVSSRGWWPIVREPFTGAWQRNQELSIDTVITNPVLWACVKRVSEDVSKLWILLLEKDANGINTETESAAFSPVLRQPNPHSTRIKFLQYWMMSKLLHGNTYALKVRDDRGVVTALYILDPTSVTLLIAPDGSLFYQVGRDNTASLETNVVVPAREIIHDLCDPVFHPYLGVSPIIAAGGPAVQGLTMQKNTSQLASNGWQPGGLLSTPHSLSPEREKQIIDYYQANYAGPENAGKLLLVSGGLDYKPLSQTAVDAQVIEQLKWADEQIPPCFGVPGCMVGIGDWPPYTDIQSMQIQYYMQALQNHLENLEELFRLGLDLPRRLSVEFDLDALLRMDMKTQVENSTKGILGGLFKPNEERAKFNRKPVPGGNAVYMQQQQFSLEALNARDQANPAPSTTNADGTARPIPPAASKREDFDADQFAVALMEQAQVHGLYAA